MASSYRPRVTSASGRSRSGRHAIRVRIELLSDLAALSSLRPVVRGRRDTLRTRDVPGCHWGCARRMLDIAAPERGSCHVVSFAQGSSRLISRPRIKLRDSLSCIGDDCGVLVARGKQEITMGFGRVPYRPARTWDRVRSLAGRMAQPSSFLHRQSLDQRDRGGRSPEGSASSAWTFTGRGREGSDPASGTDFRLDLAGDLHGHIAFEGKHVLQIPLVHWPRGVCRTRR